LAVSAGRTSCSDGQNANTQVFMKPLGDASYAAGE
jgi:hypothetical protein